MFVLISSEAFKQDFPSKETENICICVSDSGKQHGMSETDELVASEFHFMIAFQEY